MRAQSLSERTRVANTNRQQRMSRCLYVGQLAPAISIDLEFAGSYTTDAFLACHDRLSSRLGLPVVIYSDNGTTFQGANKQMTAAFRAATRDLNLLNKFASKMELRSSLSFSFH